MPAAPQSRRYLMQTHRVVSLLVAACVTAVSCTNEKVAAPEPALTAALVTANAKGGGGGGGNIPCDDYKKEECIATGRFTGGGGQRVEIGDIYVTRGFTLH